MAPPIHTELSSGDEDDAPEIFTLSQSKKDIKKHDDAIRELETAEREKKRAKNRERDRKLKEQAANSQKRRRKDEEEDEEVNSAEARMLRAMQQAKDEEDEDSEEEMGMDSGGGEDESEEDEIEEDEEMNDVGDEEDSEEDDEDDEAQDEQMADADDDDDDESSDGSEFGGIELDEPSLTSTTRAKHLPDHIFTLAAAAAPVRKLPQPKPKEVKPQKQSKRRKRSGKGPKEVVIGSRSIKALASADPFPVVSSTMAPSAKVRKFLDRGLSLKGNKSKTRGWERRPVNIGSMRRQGPAANFVRNP
ncbi:hypothetical protein Moror_10768 [Moniliophthora roreri MCA 2997]|uniref:Uncharacterized protein n=1 Tax=Moniliophthora roreri (strain MCA 2997) TaxID=1381753 RepID=V2Y8S2_MONRO|nr:hypothetical protein Moror_10768 [Moniliophthora roreri MCA 2997]